MWSAPNKRVKYTVAGISALALISGGLAVAAISGKVNSARDKLAQQKVTGQAEFSTGVIPPSSPSPEAGPSIGDPAQAPAGGPGAGESASPPAASPPAPKPSAAKPPVKPKPKPKPKPPVPPAVDNSVGAQLLVYINTKRAAKGLYPYKMSAGLVKAANLHSQCMAAERKLSHLCRSINEKPIGTRFIGVPWRGAAENAGQENASNTSAAILAASKRSTDSMLGEGPGGGHYDNLMSDKLKLIGIGVVRTSDGRVWLTQDFVTPA